MLAHETKGQLCSRDSLLQSITHVEAIQQAIQHAIQQAILRVRDSKSICRHRSPFVFSASSPIPATQLAYVGETRKCQAKRKRPLAVPRVFIPSIHTPCGSRCARSLHSFLPASWHFQNQPEIACIGELTASSRSHLPELVAEFDERISLLREVA